MARHTAEKVMEIMAEDSSKTPEQIADILEKPIYKVRKVFNEIKKSGKKGK